MNQRRKGKPKAYQLLATLVGKAPKSSRGHRVPVSDLLKVFDKIYSEEHHYSERMKKRAERATKLLAKRYPNVWRKPHPSLEAHEILLTSIIYEFMDYRSETSFLLQLVMRILRDIIEWSEKQENEPSKHTEVVATNIRQAIASQVLRSGALEKELDKVLAKKLRESQIEALPYVG